VRISPDVPLPPNATPDDAPLFQMLWETFIAINWPADTAKSRGVPLGGKDPKLSVYAEKGVPRVWETWKQSWEISDGKGTPWDSYQVDDIQGKDFPCHAVVTPKDPKDPDPCGVKKKNGDKEVTTVTKENWPCLYKKYGGTVLNGVNTLKPRSDGSKLRFELAGPIITPGPSVVRYEIRYNRELYDCAIGAEGSRSSGDSGCKRTGDRIEMPAATPDKPGAISVKAAWRRATSDEEADSYHSRDVLVVDYEDIDGVRTRVCRQEKRLLVGLHIVYKDSKIKQVYASGKPCVIPEGSKDDYTCMNQWAWATFEHKKNVPECGYAFGLTDRGYNYEPQPFKPEAGLPGGAEPVFLCRVNSIPPLSSQKNDSFQGALAKYKPWRNYMIVDLQWLVRGQGAPSSMANAMIEPYAQKDSCMGCHNGPEAFKHDFVWSLNPNVEEMIDIDGE
jgi:hypothetical protein